MRISNIRNGNLIGTMMVFKPNIFLTLEKKILLKEILHERANGKLFSTFMVCSNNE